MDKKSYLRQVPRIDLDKDLFPDTLFETLLFWLGRHSSTTQLTVAE